MRPLLEISAENYKSLRDVHVTLGPLNVLVGPNEAGKTNFLDLLQFLGDSVRSDLGPAIEARGGFDALRFRGKRSGRGNSITIGVKANVSRYSRPDVPDEYSLGFWSPQIKNSRQRYLARRESFKFKRTKGAGRRITVSGSNVEVVDESPTESSQTQDFGLASDSLGLATLPKLPDAEGGNEIARVAELFSTFRVFDVNVDAARRPSRAEEGPLAADASNLAAFLYQLSQDEELFADFQGDASAMVPGLLAIEFIPFGVQDTWVAVVLREKGLDAATDLSEASYGTIRVLALLAVLYDPSPPLLTCIEEIDHGLHPYVFDRLVERMREASERTQLLVATHSPSLVNRLHPSELIVCERRATGESRIPAVDPNLIAKKYEAASDLQLGELWFSGALGGVPK